MHSETWTCNLNGCKSCSDLDFGIIREDEEGKALNKGAKTCQTSVFRNVFCDTRNFCVYDCL